MTSLGLGDIARFPFVEPPDRRNVTAGVQLLEELGALADERLTKVGRRLARLPIDPRLARMILEAERIGCVREVVVIAAALSLQDPRERPAEQQAQADQQHARFKAEGSDFLTWLNLWRHLRQQQRELSSSAFRRMCKREFLNYLRVREWQDFESQLRQVCKEMKIQVGQPADTPDADGIHQALLAGLLSHLGALEAREKEKRGPREYLGARGTRFAIFPGSVLHRKNPQFLMAGELVETSRLWARQNAAIEPEWAERIGAHLVKRTYSEPHWSKKRAAVMAYERVTLYGVPLVADRLVSYGKVDAALSRELFIRHALVYGEWHTRHRFFEQNLRLLEEAEELEHRARRRDIVVDEHTLFDFYDARVGAEVVSGAHFDQWWKRDAAEASRPADLRPRDADPRHRRGGAGDRLPGGLAASAGEALTFPISYHFEPGAADDGLTIEVPVATLNRVAADDFSWNVPGLREELVTSLIRSLPKNLRVSFVPAPNKAREFLAAVPPGDEPLLDALERHFRSTTGGRGPARGLGLVEGARAPAADLPDRRRRAAPSRPAARTSRRSRSRCGRTLARAIAEVASDSGIARTGQTTWTFGTIEPSFTQTRAGHEVRGYPALVDEGSTVGLQVFGSEDEAEARHRLGVRRLLLLELDDPVDRVLDGLTTPRSSASPGRRTRPSPSCSPTAAPPSRAQAVDARPPVRDEASYVALRDAVGRDQEAQLRSVLADVLRVLDAWRRAEKALSGRADMAMLPALTDMRGQLGRLVHRGFVGEAGLVQLRRYPTYLAALELRRERLADQLARDRQLHGPDRRPPGGLPAPGRRAPRRPAAGRRTCAQVRWMLEEYRVSLWAQQLGTAFPVSDQRIRRSLQA